MPSREGFPSVTGTYALVLQLNNAETISVGSLGNWEIVSGYYAYTGSAQGPGGLAGRLNRHFRPTHQKRRHWHIDSLTSVAKIIHVWWEEGSANHECSWARQIANWGSIPVPGFGSGDCRCPGHLIWLSTSTDEQLSWQNQMQELGRNLETAIMDE